MNRLNIMHFNVRGLLGKKALFDKILQKYKPDICCINEVKTKRKLVFSGYNIERKDRPTHKVGGGVMILIKKDIEYENVTPPPSSICQMKPC